MMNPAAQKVIDALGRMKLRQMDADAQLHPSIRAQLVQQIEMFPSMALPDLENPVVICGMVVTQGVGEIWMVAGEGFEGSVRTILSMQRQLIRSFYAMFDLHRLHILIDPSQPGTARYARALGFESEFNQLSRRMGPRGEDLEFYIWKEGKI